MFGKMGSLHEFTCALEAGPRISSLGLRQSSPAFGRAAVLKSARGLAHSKTWRTQSVLYKGRGLHSSLDHIVWDWDLGYSLELGAWMLNLSLPMLIFDAHLDLSMNALEWNRDFSRPISEIRRRENGRNDRPDRGRGTVCFPEMRRGGVGICVATQIARYVKHGNPLPGWHSPE